MGNWQEVKPVIIADTWRTRLKKATGWMSRPKPIKIHPDRKKKKVMVKSLYHQGWSSKQLALWFKSPQKNIVRWAKSVTPENLREFEEQFSLAMRDYDHAALYKTKNRIMELVPDEKNMNALVSAARFFAGDSIRKQTNIQNNIYGDLIKRYAPEGIEAERI